MSIFLGSMFAMRPNGGSMTVWDGGLDALGRPDFDYRRRSVTTSFDPMRWLGWPRNCMCMGDATMPMAPAQANGWGEWQTIGRGNGSQKFIMGTCYDSTNATVSGAIVQGFRTSDDLFVGETTADSSGRYELGTVYPATQHYLVAYRAGSPDISGTTVNTLTPTNRDGT